MKNKLTIAALSLALLSGCSSIISKSDYAVAINSSPDGANFAVTNRSGVKVQSGVTPSVVTLKSSSGFFRGEAYTLSFEKDGFANQTFSLSSSVDGWYFGNILFGGVIGMLIVDPATGAMYNLPDRVDVALDQSVSQSSSDADTLTIAAIDDLTPEQIKRLERIR